ncbi:hypothetical protein AB1Y20_000192 [Prymnesium parvum]|uniref:Uncharacterized protein n=1 Tax=Prymnesium parvum TaxID=97485 RepID=A0AB34K760_PRYPA
MLHRQCDAASIQPPNEAGECAGNKTRRRGIGALMTSEGWAGESSSDDRLSPLPRAIPLCVSPRVIAMAPRLQPKALDALLGGGVHPSERASPQPSIAG